MNPSVRNRQSSLRWGVEQRLEFIEFRLFWEGRLNRSDLMQTFGVSVNQASADLNRYLKLAPENMIYNRSERAYLRSPVFSPVFLSLDSDLYLNQLRSVADGVLARESSWIKEYPAYDGARSPKRIVSPGTLQLVLDALRGRQAVEVRYQSLSHPLPRWRWIAPHAAGFDGFRWHVRAHCEESGQFKDFLVARIIETRGTRAARSDSLLDRDWHEYTEIVIGPNPGLSDSQRQVVALDYGMQGDQVTLRVRRALLYYTIKRLGLGEDGSERAPEQQHIVLLNRKEIDSELPSEDERETA